MPKIHNNFKRKPTRLPAGRPGRRAGKCGKIREFLKKRYSPKRWPC